MGILGRMRQAGAPEERASLNNPSVPLASSQAFSIIFGDGATSASGVNVTIDKALGIPAYWCGVTFIARTMATLPLKVYRRSDDDSTELARNDPVYRMFHDTVNEDRLTSNKWRLGMLTTALTSGRHYTYVERNAAQRPSNLWPLDPATVTPVRDDNRTIYKVKDGKRTIDYAAAEIIDIPFMLAEDGLSHRSVVGTHKDTFGLCLSLNEYASRFFRNGGVPPLALEGPQASAGAVSRATAGITDAIRQANSENRNILYLPLGHSLTNIGFNPEQAQMEAARLFQVQEIARILDLSPIFLQDLSRATFSNAEEQDLQVVKHTLSHWAKMIEQEINTKVFGAASDRRFVEFNMDGIMRGDFKSRLEGLARGIQSAIFMPDEGRALLNLPPKPGGDKLYIQSATVPIESAGQQASASAPTPGDGDDEGEGEGSAGEAEGEGNA